MFDALKERRADVDTLECLAVLVEAVPAHPCVSPVAAVFSCPSLHFLGDRSFISELGHVQ